MTPLEADFPPPYRFEFEHDWFTNNIPTWEKHLLHNRPTVFHSHQPALLEVGCYDGRATIWLLQHIDFCRVTCIDTFRGGHDHKEAGVDFHDVETRFRRNTAHWHDRVTILKGRSNEHLARLAGTDQLFELAYIDGSHMAADVLADIVLAWQCLLPHCIMILDDYGWGTERPPHERPAPAIDAFLQCYQGQYELLEKGYQVLVRKL